MSAFLRLVFEMLAARPVCWQLASRPGTQPVTGQPGEREYYGKIDINENSRYKVYTIRGLAPAINDDTDGGISRPCARDIPRPLVLAPDTGSRVRNDPGSVSSRPRPEADHGIQ